MSAAKRPRLGHRPRPEVGKEPVFEEMPRGPERRCEFVRTRRTLAEEAGRQRQEPVGPWPRRAARHRTAGLRADEGENVADARDGAGRQVQPVAEVLEKAEFPADIGKRPVRPSPSRSSRPIVAA